MRFSYGFRAALIALAAVAGVSTANADSGSIRLKIVKAGWVIGASGGNGTMTFHGRTYRLTIGGLSAGLVFGGSAADLRGTVTNIRQPSDVAGVYGTAGVGGALVAGAQAITLRNEKGAVLQLRGAQAGLMVNADLGGMTLALK